MNTGEDEPPPGLNGRLRPRKSNAPSQKTKARRRTEGKLVHDKHKRTSTPSKATPTKPDDLANKSETTAIPQLLCPYCDRKFATKQAVSKHARRVHFSSKQDSFISCLFCSHNETEANDIVRHMVENHPNQYFACLDCHTRFPTSAADLAQHKLDVCEKQKPYRSKLRQTASTGSKKSQKKISIDSKDPYTDKDFTENHGFNGVVISCEFKPSQVLDEADIEDEIITNLILPPNKTFTSGAVLDKNAVIVLDDIQWNKRIPPNFSFHNTDADQILSRLGVVHRSPRTGETTRRDWFKTIDETTQKFEKCFDTSFYSRVASNVQENLAKFLDGSFNFNPDPDSTIKTRKSKNNVVINTAEGFPILLACEQYSRNVFDSYMPRGIAPKHKWKWDTIDNEKTIVTSTQIKRDSHTNNCIISLVSSLDIWTQLCMRQKFENKFSCLPIEKKTEKQNTIGKELKEILESRELPSSSTQIVRHTSEPILPTDGMEFAVSLGLVPSTIAYDVQPAVLSGEWVRPRCYVCCACGAQTRDSRALSSHISTQHPNAQVQHYDIVGEPLLNADIWKHLYVPPSQVYNRTRPLRGFRDCTKCKSSVSLEDLHQHMLDCAGDTPAVRRKCRYKPFGVRRRRPRLPDNTIRKRMRKDIRAGQKTHLRPRIKSEVGDAETIRKMIADLPAKRHRVLVNPTLRSGRKHDKQRNKLLMKRRSSDDPKSRRMRPTKEPKSSGFSDHSSKDNDSSKGDDEDNMPLKPRIKRLQDNSHRQSDNIKRKTMFNRTKRNIQMKCPNLAEPPPVESGGIEASGEENNDLPSNDVPDRIDLNSGQCHMREHAGRGRGGNRNQQPGGSRQNGNPNNNNNNNDDIPPAPNLPLKHSIASLTASNETHDKSVQFHHMFLVQQECNEIATQHSPTEEKQLFENEAAVSRLDKPPLPLPCRKKGPPTPDPNANQKNSKLNKPRKGLNDCIAMLKNKLVDPEPSALNANQVSVQCGNDEPLDSDPRFYVHGPIIDSQIDPKPAEVFSRSVMHPETTVEPSYLSTLPLQIQLEQTTPKPTSTMEQAVTPSIDSSHSRSKKSLMISDVSSPQKPKDVPGKRKSTRTRSTARAEIEAQQKLFDIPSQIEIIPQRSRGNAKTLTTSRTRRDAYAKLVSPESDTKKKQYTERNKKSPQNVFAEPQLPSTHHQLGSRLADPKQLSAEQRLTAAQRSLSEQTSFSELSEHRLHGDLRAHAEHQEQKRCEQRLLREQRQSVDQRTLTEQQYAEIRAFSEQMGYNEFAYSDHVAYNEQRQYDMRLLAEHRRLSERRTGTEHLPHTEVQSHSELRLSAEQRAYLEQISLNDQRVLIEHRLQTEPWLHAESWPLADGRRHDPRLYVGRRPHTEQRTHSESRSHADKRAHCDEKLHSGQPTFAEKRQTAEQRTLEPRCRTEQRVQSERTHTNQRAYTEQTHSEQRLCIEDRQSIERRLSVELRQSIDRRQSNEQRQANERRQCNELRLSLERRPSIEHRQNAERRQCKEQRQSLERTASIEQRQNAERKQSNEQRQSLERTASIEQRQNAERKQSNEQRQSLERTASIEQRQNAERKQSNEQRQSLERTASLEQRQNTERRQSNEQRQSLERTASIEQRQNAERRQCNDQRQSFERTTSIEQQQNAERRQCNEQRQSMERTGSIEQRQNAERRQCNDQRQSFERTTSIEQRQNAERRQCNEQIHSMERTASIEQRQNVDLTQSIEHRRSLLSGQKLGNNHKPHADQRTFMEPRSVYEQKSLIEQRVNEQMLQLDPISSIDHRILHDQRSLAVQKMVNEHRKFNETRTRQHDPRAYERHLNDPRTPNDYRLLHEQRSPIEKRSLKDQRPLKEHYSLNEQRLVRERTISNEYRYMHEQRSVIEDSALTGQKVSLDTRSLNDQKIFNELKSLTTERLSTETTTTVKSPLVETFVRTKTPTENKPAVEDMASTEHQPFIGKNTPSETYVESNITRSKPSDMYPGNSSSQSTSVDIYPERELHNTVVDESYSENDYNNEVSSDVPPLAHASTNADSMVSSPLDLSGKILSSDCSEDLTKHENSLIVTSYDSYETLDLSNKTSDRQGFDNNVNITDGVVDLRVKPSSQILTQDCSVGLRETIPTNEGDNITDLPYRHCEDDDVPTDLSVRGNLGNISGVHQVEHVVYDIQDLSSHRTSYVKETDHNMYSNIPTSCTVIKTQLESDITIEEPTDLSGKPPIVSIYAINAHETSSTIDTKECVSIDLTQDMLTPAVTVAKIEKEQQDEVISIKTNTVQPILESSHSKTVMDMEPTPNDEVNTQNSDSSSLSEQSMLLQKPVYDPTLKIPQYKIRETSTSVAIGVVETVSQSPLAVVTMTGLTPNPGDKATSFSTSLPNLDTIVNTRTPSERLPFGCTGSSLVMPFNTISRNLPVYTLPNPVTASLLNKYESTTPVYTLANACISVTRIESTSATTLTNTLLSIAGSTIANTTSVYTLAGTTIGAPMNYNAVPNNASQIGHTLSGIINPNMSIGETILGTDRQNKNDLEVKSVENQTNKINTVDQDQETARKIAMLPKELVDILGNMPADHRNQLLNVLPQYVSTSTAVSINHSEMNEPNWTNTNTSMPNRLPSSASQQRVPTENVTASEYNNVPGLNTLSPNYCLPPHLLQSTSQFGIYDMDSKHSFAYLLKQPPPPPPPLPSPHTSALLLLPPPPPPPLIQPPLPPFPPPDMPLIKTQSDCEDVKPQWSLLIATKEEKDPDVINIDDERPNDATNNESKIIDLTEDDAAPINHELIRLAEDLTKPSVSVPPQDITNYTAVVKQKSANDKTASLRAVRIKTQSERNKSAPAETKLVTKTIVESEKPVATKSPLQSETDINKKPTIESEIRSFIKTVSESPSTIVVDAENVIDELSDSKKLAIQQAEISSTQQGNKKNPVVCNLTASTSSTETETPSGSSPSITTPAEGIIVIQVDKDQPQTHDPILKTGKVTSSITDQNVNRKSSNENHIVIESINKDVSPADKLKTARTISMPDNVLVTIDNAETKNDSHNDSSTGGTAFTEEEDSDDDVSLAVIVKKKQLGQQKLTHQIDENNSILSHNVNVEEKPMKNDQISELKNVTKTPLASNNEVNNQLSRDPNKFTTKTEVTCDEDTGALNEDRDVNLLQSKNNRKTDRVRNTLELLTEKIVDVDDDVNIISKLNTNNLTGHETINDDQGNKVLRNVLSQGLELVVDKTESHNILTEPIIIEANEKVIIIDEFENQNKIQEMQDVTMNVDHEEILTSHNEITNISRVEETLVKKAKDDDKFSGLREQNIELHPVISIESADKEQHTSAAVQTVKTLNVMEATRIQGDDHESEESFRLLSCSDKKSEKKSRSKSKNPDKPEESLVKDLQLDSELELNNTAHLRRSRRGKSMFLDSKVPEIDYVASSEITIEQKTPLTKKQLIFSKLMLDEENNVHPLDHSTPEKDTTDKQNVAPLDTKTFASETICNIKQSDDHHGEKNKGTKRKKSPQAKRKKKKSIDHNSKADDSAHIELIGKEPSTNLLAKSSIDVGFIPLPTTKNGHDVKVQVSEEKYQKDVFNDDHDTITAEEQELQNETRNNNLIPEKRKLINLTTSELDRYTKTKKSKLTYKEEQGKKHVGIKEDNLKHREKTSATSLTRTTCYMSAARRTRSKSVVVKSSTADSYDPYDINLDDMIEKESKKKSDKISYRRQLTKPSCSQTYSKISTKHNTSSSATHTVVSKSSKITKTNISRIIDVPAGCSKDMESDSDDSSKSDVPLKKYVEEKERRILELEDSEDRLFDDDLDFDSNEYSNDKHYDRRKKSRRTLAAFNNLDKSSAQKETDAQLRSEQFMESFGFFSERKPRKSNLLASKKISETFHIIANESDDMYLGFKERSAKRSLQNENRKSSEANTSSRAQQPSGSRRIIKRGQKKKTYTKPLPCYCGICKKEFRRPDNYLRHQMTLLHISKLSEIEMKVKTIPILEEPNYLIVYKQQLDKLKILTNKLAKKRKNSKSAQKIKLPTLDQILADVNKTIREQQLSQRGLSRDEALFLDCCELLKAHKSDVNTSHKKEVNTTDATLHSGTNKYTCTTESTVKEFDLLERPTKGDGDVDSITAKNILESEEVRNLENDLISGLKEAANASTLKTKVPFQRSISDVGLSDDINMAYTSHNADESYEPIDNFEAVQSVRSKGKVKEKMYPDIIDSIDMFEDKFDKIKRKCRSQAAAAKHMQTLSEPSTSYKGRKKSEKKKGKKSSKKNHRGTQVLTKGALKGFDGIKVSIPTSDINMSAIVPSLESSMKKKKKTRSKKKREKRDSESSGKYDSGPRSKDNSITQKKVDVYEFMDNEDAELFELRPSTLMERFKSISNKDTPSTSKVHPVVNEMENTSESVSDGDDFVYMSDDYVCSDDETENSLLSCEVSSKVGSEIKKNTSPLKRKDAVEKNAVMGKIFKHNAVRSDKKSIKCKEPAKPKANLDQLFDSLLEDEPSSSMLKNDVVSPRMDDFLPSKNYEHTSKRDKYNRTPLSRDEFSSPTKFSTPSPKGYSISPLKEFDKSSKDCEPSTSKRHDDIDTMIDYGPSTSKKHDTMNPKDYRDYREREKRSPKKQETASSNRHDVLLPLKSSYLTGVAKHKETTFYESDDDELHKIRDVKDKPLKEKSPSIKLDEGISTSYDYSAEVFDQMLIYDDMGVARQRARRKCTVGKQNVLAETWSSESEPDGRPPRPNSAESVVLSSGRKKKGKKKDGQPSSGRRVNSRQVTVKKQDVDGRLTNSNRGNSAGGSRSGGHSADADSDEVTAELDAAGPSHAPLAPPGCKPRPRASAYFWASEGDDEQEHLQQHGWIVGDSHKKLVTMLAHAKGRKRNNDDKRHLVE